MASPAIFIPAGSGARVLMLIYICMQIVKGISRRARGTTLISVSHRGLSFSNVPDQMRSGSFQRAQIETLIVRIDQAGLSGKVFRLQMNVTTDVRSVVLLVSRSVQALYSIRRELLRPWASSTSRRKYNDKTGTSMALESTAVTAPGPRD